jgi:hypothetical protein
LHDREQIKPEARTDDLLIEELDDGVVVYDRRNDSAHWLDSAAAAVWRMSNAELTVGEIAVRCELDEEQVTDVLERLDGIDLMVEPGVSRRTALRRIVRIGGTAVVLAPVISSIAVPVALANTSHCANVSCSNFVVTDCGTGKKPTAQAAGDAICKAAIGSGCQATSTCTLTSCSNAGHWVGFCSF